MRKRFLIPLLVSLLFGCGTEQKENGFVSKEMYGDKWPLTVDRKYEHHFHLMVSLMDLQKWAIKTIYFQ